MKVTEVLQVLSDSTRLRMMRLLGQEELSVAELQEILEMGQSRISSHLVINLHLPGLSIIAGGSQKNILMRWRRDWAKIMFREEPGKRLAIFYSAWSLPLLLWILGQERA
jgi:predicted transcriptional regulator